MAAMMRRWRGRRNEQAERELAKTVLQQAIRSLREWCNKSYCARHGTGVGPVERKKGLLQRLDKSRKSAAADSARRTTSLGVLPRPHWQEIPKPFYSTNFKWIICQYSWLPGQKAQFFPCDSFSALVPCRSDMLP